MKSFAKIGFLVVSALAGSQARAQCTPDTTMDKGTILPQAISYAYLNTAYSEVIYFRAPLDTSAQTPLGTYPATIDSMEITSVNGLPAGFTYTCYENNCMIKGGEASCITLQGTAASTGNYPLTVYITTYATLKTMFGDVPVSQNDSNTNYTLYVFGSTGMSANDLQHAIDLYPNPAKDVLHISNPLNLGIRASLFDLTGKLVEEKQLAGSDTFSLSGLPKGLYMVRLQAAGETLVKRIMVE